MKRARIIVKEQILGPTGQCSDFDLVKLDGIYYSPFETFEESQTDSEIFEYLEEKYKSNYEHACEDSIVLQYA